MGYRTIFGIGMVQKVNLFKPLVSVFLCQFAGAIGSGFTASSLEKWYLLLEKPTFTPSSQVFFRPGSYIIHLWESHFMH
ncbi:hypothetical protein FXW07_13925 [Methanosarcina sp. DH1]|uniref:TspO/MBR family protein n=1 Tax=Methanosarcina sp. DH1 TaxID=2605695 RepID=UPI001E613A3A|nr:hypothetical protein [Methanosarcina sp. DH1]MCC4767670.1 hypothetical protein [Methanosarcina sp. DH1]